MGSVLFKVLVGDVVFLPNIIAKKQDPLLHYFKLAHKNEENFNL